MKTEQAVEQLAKLVQEREQALTSYKQYQKNISKDSVLEVRDDEIFAKIGEAYKKHQDLIVRVKMESEAVFKALPAGLQFGLGVLGKSLFVGAVMDRMQPTKEWYGLVAKPYDVTRNSDGTETVNKYACDVVKVPSNY